MWPDYRSELVDDGGTGLDEAGTRPICPVDFPKWSLTICL